MDKPSPNQAQQEAEEWFVHMQSNNLSPDDLRKFQEWRSRSPFHNFEYEKVEKDWEILGKLSQDLHSKKPCTPEVIPPQNSTYSTTKPRAKKQQPNRYYWSAAACILLSVTLFAIVCFDSSPTTEHYVSAIGEQRLISLKDGSQITLNTASSVEISYTKVDRYIKFKYGEAYFEVAKDPSRPFIVGLGQGTVTALGTAFNIRKNRHLATVTITEGAVIVEESKTRTNLEPDSKIVTISNEISFSQYGLSNIRKISNINALSWKNKMLVFNQQPLEYVINELNRYLSTPVTGINKKTKNILISGTFDLSNLEEALLAITNNNALMFDQQTMSIK